MREIGPTTKEGLSLISKPTGEVIELGGGYSMVLDEWVPYTPDMVENLAGLLEEMTQGLPSAQRKIMISGAVRVINDYLKDLAKREQKESNPLLKWWRHFAQRD